MFTPSCRTLLEAAIGRLAFALPRRTFLDDDDDDGQSWQRVSHQLNESPGERKARRMAATVEMKRNK